MGETEIWRRLTNTIARFFDDDSLTLAFDTVASDVPGWDSLANVELMVEIEDAFEIRFRTGETTDLACLGDLAALISRRLER